MHKYVYIYTYVYIHMHANTHICLQLTVFYIIGGIIGHFLVNKFTVKTR